MMNNKYPKIVKTVIDYQLTIEFDKDNYIGEMYNAKNYKQNSSFPYQ